MVGRFTPFAGSVIHTLLCPVINVLYRLDLMITPSGVFTPLVSVRS
jgi:hypothetical protein